MKPVSPIVLLCLLALGPQVFAGEGEILFVSSFEGTGNVPQFVAVETQAGVVERRLAIDIDTSDPVNQAGIAFSLDQAPAGLTIRANTGEISWTPRADQVGVAAVTVRAEDFEGLSNTLTFEIEVIDPNAAPLITPIADRGVVVGDLLALTVEATDDDPGDPPTFSLDQAPSAMTLDPVSGLLAWVPTAADAGAHPVTVRATDVGGRFDQAPFTIVVVEQNSPPMLVPIADRGAAPGVGLAVQPTASDPDPGDVLSWSLIDRPTGMTIDPASGWVDWTPTGLQLGPHMVTVMVRDALGASDQASFEITVDLNRAPVAVDDSGFRVEIGDTLSVPALGVLDNDRDPNSDVLSAQLVDPPQRGVLSLGADGGFDYTPEVPVGTIGLVETLSYSRANGSSTWTPLIGNLDDDPQSELIIGDGAGCCTGFLIAVDGVSGLEEWVVTLPGRQLDRFSKPALADIDLDGRPEILIIGGEADSNPTSPLRIYAFEHDGQLKWISESLPGTFYLDGVRRSNRELSSAAITVADLDQDGLPEILAAPDFGPAGYHVWDHEGRSLFTVAEPGTSVGDGSPTRVTVVDLDLDGDPEIVVGNVAWSHDGELLWKRDDNFGHARASTYPLVANLDDDPYPELVRTRGGLSGPGNIVVWNHDGTDMLTPDGDPWEVARPFGFNTAPITIADVDADGYADVLLPLPDDVNVFEVLDGRDGSVKWSKSVTTRSMGATVFDLDRDGFVEVLFIDEASNLYVWDGRDGTEKLVLTMNNPRPGDYTVPVFADIDADGASELVVPGGFSFGFDTALSIWESPNDDWAPMRSIWNEHRYHVTNVNDDLTVPAQERPHWLLPGLNQAMINQRLPEARTESLDTFTYRASDGELASNVAEVAIEVLPPNSPPRILSTPPRLASPGFEYVYSVLAVDADAGELLQFTIAEGPPAMSIDADGRVTWTPGAGDLGLHPVVVSVTDSLGVPALQHLVIEVRDPVLVPDLAGRTEAEALDALAAVSLRADPLRDTFSDSVAVGAVAAQAPPAATPIAAGAGVTVEISRGPLPVTVPRLVGLDLDDAITAIGAAGLAATPPTWINDPGTPRGMVVEQDPAPNAQAPPGSAVTLVASGGPRARVIVDPPLIPAGQSATVSVEIRDLDGTPLDPQPAYTLSLDLPPDSFFGTPPSLDGDAILTFVDSQGEFELDVQFLARGAESVSVPVGVLPAISDGPGGSIYSEFTRQQQLFSELVDALIDALELGDGPTIEALDQALADLEQAVDLRRLRTMTAIAPEGGVPPTPEQAIAGGLPQGTDDATYTEIGVDLVALLETIDGLVREGTVPDFILNALNQDLAAVAQVRSGLAPSSVGVLRASPAITALLGNYAPRLMVADLSAIRQALRDEGILAPDGTALAGRFTLPGILSAVRIRNDIIKDFYVPYLGDVARAMGQVVAADLLRTYANAGSIVGIITGASQSIHVFEIAPSVIEGFGFDPKLSPNNAVTMVGPSLFDAVSGAASGLPSSSDFKDLNSAFDAIQAQIDNANDLEQAWKDANTTPNGIVRGCILDGTPGCRQLIYPDGFASVYESDGGLSLPAPILIIARNLESGSIAVFVAGFVPTSEE